MTTPPVSIEQLKATTLPALFAGASEIGEYGNTATSAAMLQSVAQMMEAGSAAKLAASIAAIVTGLSDADPQKIARKPSFADRLLGREIEREVRYRVARQSIDQLLEQAEVHADGVRRTIRAIDQLIAEHAGESERLKMLLQAGREYLAENPDAGVHVDPSMEFDRPRERFARKLANLATLLTSHDMSHMQMKLARAQAIDMLDRFAETVTVLVPVWRQHTLALVTTSRMRPELVKAATEAHQALMRSLAKSLDSIDH
ncbi:toxic anion resistance protein [Xanthomonas campestris pv. campestris]|uniref:toxic anion resistance protein n=1 Tax=Xanthomonas campestris TaxID=339 RepID=UPI001E3C6E7C|nr:toxic anion resistance protein [Xanthomonas campestris]MCD0253136.1 toxic anion resistance protein [Xanthomonas campestris pv. campestris]